MHDQTRRNWLVTISHAAAGVGLAGTALTSAADAVAGLPPGIYEGSAAHLGHALMNSQRYHPIPPGCPTDYVRPRTAPFQPLFFNTSEFVTVRRLTRLLLGEMSDDSASSQQTAEWIDFRVFGAAEAAVAARRLHPLCQTLAVACLGAARAGLAANQDPAKTCRDGLVWLSRAAQEKHSKDFMALEVNEQITLLYSIGDRRPEGRTETTDARFFSFLKSETIRGFYTSEAGLKELDYKGNAFYARSPGCPA